MNRFTKFFVAAVAVVASSTSVYAFDLSQLGSLINNSSASSIINGLVSTEKITVADLEGSWTYSSPAVSFKSENLLEKAGGAAAAATIENKLAPYYKRVKLDKVTFIFDGSDNVTLKFANGRTITGTVTEGTTEGTMIFDFSKLHATKLAQVTAYVSKGTELSIMFDVTKLQTLVSAVAKYSGKTALTTMSSLLNKYKGIYAGFKLKK